MKLRQLLCITLVLMSTTTLLAQSSLDNILSLSRLPYLKKNTFGQISSYDTSGGNADYVHIKPGEAAVLGKLKGPCVITHIWCTISAADRYFLRRLLLRMYWDNETTPSVEVPIGDFFGTGFGYKHYLSDLVGMSSGGYYSYIPMPFNDSARVEVVNQTGQDVPSFYYHIDYQKMNGPLESDVAYFHAQWRRELRTDPKHNYTILEAKGEGHFIGCNLTMQSYKGNLWFLEGDEMVYVDGEKFPSMYGTGTEDYFVSGWYFNKGEYSTGSHGLIWKDDSLGRISAYRFQVGDAIPFKKSIKFTIEHGHANEEIADYSSTAYWYQKEPHQLFPNMLQASLRIPLRVEVPSGGIEAESLKIIQASSSSHIESMVDYGPEWSGLCQLRFDAEKKGDEGTVVLHTPTAERYDIDMYFTKGPDYDTATFWHDGAKIGGINGFNKEIIPGGKITLNNLKPVNHEIPLRFTVEGKEKQSKGYAVGLDVFLMTPHREFIVKWKMIGPFPNPSDTGDRRLGLDMVFPPEKETDFGNKYDGVNGQQVAWTDEKAPESGGMDLVPKYSPNEHVIVYALTYIYAPDDQPVLLYVGSDDGVKVFLNDATIFRKMIVRGADADQDTIATSLKKGWNKLMLKIENNLGGYGFYARILDSDHTFIISSQKEK